MAQDLAGFLGLAALMVTLVAWLRSEMNGRFNHIETTLAEHGATLAVLGERVARVEATLAALGERLTRVETTQTEHGERL